MAVLPLHGDGARRRDDAPAPAAKSLMRRNPRRVGAARRASPPIPRPVGAHSTFAWLATRASAAQHGRAVIGPRALARNP